MRPSRAGGRESCADDRMRVEMRFSPPFLPMMFRSVFAGWACSRSSTFSPPVFPAIASFGLSGSSSCCLSGLSWGLRWKTVISVLRCFHALRPQFPVFSVSSRQVPTEFPRNSPLVPPVSPSHQLRQKRSVTSSSTLAVHGRRNRLVCILERLPDGWIHRCASPPACHSLPLSRQIPSKRPVSTRENTGILTILDNLPKSIPI